MRKGVQVIIGLAAGIGLIIILNTALPVASLTIGRLPEMPNNPKLPLQHVDSATIRSNNPGLFQILSELDRSFDENAAIHYSTKMTISRSDAASLLDTIPFTYYDPNTVPGGDIHSTNIEINGKYYGIVLLVPKWTGLSSSIR